MKGDIIAESEHVARFCSPKTVSDGVVQPAAFMLRHDEEELSVNWLEFLQLPDRSDQIQQLKAIFSTKGFGIGANARFAVLNVGRIVETVRRDSEDFRELTVTHQPEINDESHAEIVGLRENDEAIAELVAQLVEESYPARQ